MSTMNRLPVVVKRNHINALGNALAQMGRCVALPNRFPTIEGPERLLVAMHGKLGMRATCFSTNSQQQASPPTPKSFKSSLRHLVKPFLLKCHPDVIVSQAQDSYATESERVELSDSVKEINLKAIQNLNMYLDLVQGIQDSIVNFKTIRLPKERTVLVDFVLLLEDSNKKGVKKATKALMMSRRKMQLALPTRQLLEFPQSLRGERLKEEKTERVSELRRQVTIQLAKLMRVAGLDVPRHVMMGLSSDDNAKTKTNPDGTKTYVGDPSLAREGLEGVYNDGTRKFSRAKYLANQEAFVRNIDWNRVNKLHSEAVKDMEADIASSFLYQKKHSARRRQLVASIIANIKVDRGQKESRANSASQDDDDDKNKDEESSNTVNKDSTFRKPGASMLEELIALRRISLLLEDNFDDLNLEGAGTVWWTRLQLVLTQPRPYNTSSSALYQRVKRRTGDNGFSFTLHEDSRVTMTVPLDFRDDEFLGELNRNMFDFEQFVGDGMDDIFFDGAVPI